MNEPLAFTSTEVKRLRRLLGRRRARLDQGLFVVEGPTLIAEAVAAGLQIVAEYVAPDGDPVSNTEPRFLAPGVIERVANTANPQPNLAIVEIPQPDVDLATAHLILVADRIGDPGNLGTILRSAEAAGVSALAITAGTVDAYNPKVVRASAGAVLHLPIIETDLSSLAGAGFALLGTSSHGGVAHTALDWDRKIAIVMGNEAHGITDSDVITEWVQIEHVGRAESLNVAMAATVLVFEALRNRVGRPVGDHLTLLTSKGTSTSDR